ncbi:MAG: nucleotidyltransferase family protein [Pseudomonadota bacterium]
MTEIILGDRAAQMLCELADPEAELPATYSEGLINDGDLADLCDYHGIQTTVWRKLSESGVTKLEANAQIAELATAARATTVFTMLLDAEAAKISQFFIDAGLPWTFVKGASFAQNLYPHVADRPYTDLDILVPKSAMPAARDLLKKGGYRHIERPRAQKDAVYEEEKWMPVGNDKLLIELHTDLVHQPALRKRVTFGYDDYRRANLEEISSPVGLLMTAIVHGALGHKFHQLKLAVDVLQAMRAIDPSETDATVAVARELKVSFELGACARLVQAMFPGAAKNETVQSFAEIVWSPTIINRATVVNAHKRDHYPSRIRRHAFRFYQRSLAFG